MKLYDIPLSPFAARCRAQIYTKGLEVELVPPPGGTSSGAYRAINPIGKVPALEVDGEVIPESAVICEYLEDRFPEPPLLPADPLERARVRGIVHFTDLYVVPGFQVLFNQVDPRTRDPELVERHLSELEPRHDQLDGFLRPGPFAVGASPTLADCALMPLYFFATQLYPFLGRPDPTEGRARLGAWWGAVGQDRVMGRVGAELSEALAQQMRGG